MTGDNLFGNLPQEIKDKYHEYISRVEDVRKNMESSHVGMELLKLHPFRVEFETSLKMYLESRKEQSETEQAALAKQQLDAVQEQMKVFKKQQELYETQSKLAKIRHRTGTIQAVTVAVLAVLIGIQLYFVYHAYTSHQQNTALLTGVNEQIAQTVKDLAVANQKSAALLAQSVAIQNNLMKEQKSQVVLDAATDLIKAASVLRSEKPTDRDWQKYYGEKIDTLLGELDKRYAEATGQKTSLDLKSSVPSSSRSSSEN